MTDWDALYRAGETGWDKGEPAPALVDLLENGADGRFFVAGRVLAPGCGRGHDLKAIARNNRVADAVGIDLSETAVFGAAENLSGIKNARVVRADLFDLPGEFLGAFDTVFEHTCFCAIPRNRRGDYVRAVRDALKPGGILVAIFSLNPRDNPDPAIGPPFSATLEELDTRFTPDFDNIVDQIPARAFPGREGRERLQVWKKREDVSFPLGSRLLATSASGENAQGR